MNQQSRKHFTFIINWALVASIVLVILGGTKVILDRNQVVEDRLKQSEALEKEIAEKKEKLRELGVEYHRLQMDPEAIESVARERLNLVRPGEIVLEFSETSDENVEKSLTDKQD